MAQQKETAHIAAGRAYLGSPTRARTWDLRINSPGLDLPATLGAEPISAVQAWSIFGTFRYVMAPWTPRTAE
jgi:hypothetical protein